MLLNLPNIYAYQTIFHEILHTGFMATLRKSRHNCELTYRVVLTVGMRGEACHVTVMSEAQRNVLSGSVLTQSLQAKLSFSGEFSSRVAQRYNAVGLVLVNITF